MYPGQDGVDGVTGAEAADGEDGCRRAVRRQIGAGTDWIKVIELSRDLPSSPTLMSFPIDLRRYDDQNRYAP